MIIPVSYPPLSSLQSFRGHLQQAVEAQHPATLVIDGVPYEAALMVRMGGKSTMDGGYISLRNAVFSVQKTSMDLSVLRQVDKPGQPLRRLDIIHEETGLKYKLVEETHDPHGPAYRLECEQAEG